MEINNRLVLLRKEKNKSQVVTAGLLGYHTTTYQRWEENISQMKLTDAINIAKYYNVSLDYLAGLSNEKNGGRNTWTNQKEGEIL